MVVGMQLSQAYRPPKDPLAVLKGWAGEGGFGCLGRGQGNSLPLNSLQRGNDQKPLTSQTAPFNLKPNPHPPFAALSSSVQRVGALRAEALR